MRQNQSDTGKALKIELRLDLCSQNARQNLWFESTEIIVYKRTRKITAPRGLQ